MQEEEEDDDFQLNEILGVDIVTTGVSDSAHSYLILRDVY